MAGTKKPVFFGLDGWLVDWVGQVCLLIPVWKMNAGLFSLYLLCLRGTRKVLVKINGSLDDLLHLQLALQLN